VSSTNRVAEGTGPVKGRFSERPRSEISHETGLKRPIIKGSARSTRGTTLSRIDQLKAEIESLPSEEIAEIFCGCRKKTGRSGTRKSRPTPRLAGLISLPMRPDVNLLYR
jgi:hypothetical protein